MQLPAELSDRLLRTLLAQIVLVRRPSGSFLRRNLRLVRRPRPFSSALTLFYPPLPFQLYAPVPTSTRPSSGLSAMQMAEFGDNTPRTYGASGLGSPSAAQDGFEVSQVCLCLISEPIRV